MIVYRCLTSDELISMINNIDYDNALIKGQNTFKYDSKESYKHFFMFANHAYYYMKQKGNVYACIGQYVIPNEIIEEKGYGYYSNVKTMRNDKLYGWYMPLPEITVKKNDFENKYLYKIKSSLYSDFVTNQLDKDDNLKYNEPVIDYLRLDPNISGYLDYSYSDIYYEMVYQLSVQHNMDFKKVIDNLKDLDLYEEIKNYFENNKKFFQKQTKRYVKNNKN